MKTHAAKNFKKEPTIHIRKHACEKKRKRLSDRSHTHWSLRLTPSSTDVKAPLHNTMCWKNQKQWVKPFWIEIPAPLHVHWMISSDWLNISESQGKPELLSRLTQTTTGSEFSFSFFFYNQGISWTRSSLFFLCELYVFSVFGSLCLSSPPTFPQHCTFCQYRGSTSWHLQFSYHPSWAQLGLVIFQTAVAWTK